MQVYVPENLWISSSAACGSMLRGDGQTVSRVVKGGGASDGNAKQGIDKGFRSSPVSSATHTPAPDLREGTLSLGKGPSTGTTDRLCAPVRFQCVPALPRCKLKLDCLCGETEVAGS